ncbi:MAG: PIN domain-containing protein [Candidatus Aenigmatarchaeota archaeon]
MYVTDTHSFLWFLTKDERLSPKIREIFRLCDKGKEIIVIPSIVLLECLYICEKKKVDVEFREVLLKIRETFNYLVYPLDEEIVIRCQKITKLKDPHDRIVVATAQILNSKLITRDYKIKDSKLVETIW